MTHCLVFIVDVFSRDGSVNVHTRSFLFVFEAVWAHFILLCVTLKLHSHYIWLPYFLYHACLSSTCFLEWRAVSLPAMGCASECIRNHQKSLYFYSSNCFCMLLLAWCGELRSQWQGDAMWWKGVNTVVEVGWTMMKLILQHHHIVYIL